MFKNFLPYKIITIKNSLIKNLLIIMVLIVSLGLLYSLFFSPPDYIQGDSVRIMYVHVPSSFISLGLFAIIGTISILNLTFKCRHSGDIVDAMLWLEQQDDTKPVTVPLPKSAVLVPPVPLSGPCNPVVKFSLATPSVSPRVDDDVKDMQQDHSAARRRRRQT